MDFDPVDGNDIVGAAGDFIRMDRNAGLRGTEDHRVHAGPHRHAHRLLGDAVAGQDFHLVFRDAAAMAAHGGYEKRLHAKLLELIEHCADDDGQIVNAAASHQDGGGLAGA